MCIRDSGNIILAATTRDAEDVNHVLLLAPSSSGELSMLAGGSIFAAGAHTCLLYTSRCV